MCNEKCSTCNGTHHVTTEIEGTGSNHTVTAPCPECSWVGWNPFPWIDGKLVPMDPAEERKVKREFERNFVGRDKGTTNIP